MVALPRSWRRWAVVVPDHSGAQLPSSPPRPEGHASLERIRAAENFAPAGLERGEDSSRDVVLLGGARRPRGPPICSPPTRPLRIVGATYVAQQRSVKIVWDPPHGLDPVVDLAESWG